MYRPEFKHESTATSTMRFMIVAANGMPIRSSAIANGEELGAISFHGTTARMQNTEPT